MKKEQRKGPLRKVMQYTRHATHLYDQDRAILACGHEGKVTSGAMSARCGKCHAGEKTDPLWVAASLVKEAALKFSRGHTFPFWKKMPTTFLVPVLYASCSCCGDVIFAWEGMNDPNDGIDNLSIGCNKRFQR